MTARSARAARHRRIPQQPKPAQVTVYRAPVPGDLAAVRYLAGQS